MQSGTEQSRMYNYVRSRQLEGTFSNDPLIGAWIQSGIRICKGWGSPTESEWPYDGNAANWPPAEPANIDYAAKKRRTLAYQRVRSLDECRVALANGRPVVAALKIAAQPWLDSLTGEIPTPPTSKIDSGHSVEIVGYDETEQKLQLRNSWGNDWGDKGYGQVNFDYFERFVSEAWVIIPAPRLPTTPPQNGIVERVWGITDYFASSPLHGFEVFDSTRDESIGWSFVVQRDGYADIEELFVRPAYRGRGYGSNLANLVNASPQLQGTGSRFWIGHVDASAASSPAAGQILRRLGLNTKTSSLHPWAACLAV
jgi:GNAT superfamily N-acetyltransferase